MARSNPTARTATTRSALTKIFAPHSLDAQRYALYRSGMALPEIAARENVKLSTVEKSIEKMKIERELYSKEAVDIAGRRVVLEAMPVAGQSLIEALTATRDRILSSTDDDGNDTTTVIQEADHALRLKALDGLNKLVESLKESVPLVSNSITNQNQQLNAVGISQGGQALSFESLTRQLREEKGIALETEKKENLELTGPLPDTIDFELQEDLDTLAEAEAEEARRLADKAGQDQSSPKPLT